MNRAYSQLEIKSIDEDKRVITGLATSPAPDRMDDIVEPRGAVFKLPLPLIWMHDSSHPVGNVIAAKVTDDGITVTCQFEKVDEPPSLKDDLDRAWAMVKAKLVRGLSIGFNPLESTDIEGSRWGRRFTRWEWLELSPVVIPAHQDANIQTIKAIDRAQLAVEGREQSEGNRKPPPGGSGKQKQAAQRGVNLNPKGNDMKTLQEQIAALEAKRAASTERMTAVMQKGLDEGRSTDEAEGEEFDTLQAEVRQIDADLVRLKALEAINVAKAKPVTHENTANAEAASQTRGGTVLSVKDNLPPGCAFAQVIKCLGMAKGDLMLAERMADAQDRISPRVRNVIKAAVAAGSTSNTTWAGNLIGDEGGVYADFVEFLRPKTILGRFGSNGIPALRQVSFRVPLIGQTSGGAGYWTGEGKAKPLTKFDFARTTLEPLKVANIAVLTMEVLRDSNPSADVIVRDSLVAALRERLDIDFIDPAKTASAGISPASVTNGVTAVVSSGNDAADIRADLKALFEAFIADNNAPTSGVWIMSSTTALSASLMTNPLGQPEFPGVNMNGGTLMGLPVITSEYAAANSDGGIVVLVNAQDIYLGDEGGFSVDVSREASLQMDDEPTQSSVATVTGSTMVSMFQTNSVAFRAERTINWAKRRAGAVAYLSGVNWGSAS